MWNTGPASVMVALRWLISPRTLGRFSMQFRSALMLVALLATTGSALAQTPVERGQYLACDHPTKLRIAEFVDELHPIATPA